jgi:predicted dehydrogenase
MAVLKYKNGVSFAKTCAMEMGGFERRQLVITGSKGTVELRPLEMYGNFRGQYTGIRKATSEVWVDPGYRTATKPQNRYDSMMDSFAQMVRGEKENPYTYDYELNLYKLVLRCCGVKI